LRVFKNRFILRTSKKTRGEIMVEKVFKLKSGDDKVVEKVVMDENIHYMHMIFGKDQGLPEHYANSNLYMTVFRGKLSIQLDEEEPNEYDAGTLLKEIIVVKAPAPTKDAVKTGK